MTARSRTPVSGRGRRARRRPIRPALAALLLALGLALPAPGQEPAPAGEPPAEEPAAAAPPAAPPAEAVKLSEVTAQGEETRAQLAESRAKLAMPSDVETIRAELYKEVLSVQDARRTTRDELAGPDQDPKELLDLERDWIVRENTVDAWRTKVNAYGSTIDQEIARLDELSKLWKATRMSVTDAGSAVGAERAEALLAEIGQVEDLAREQVRELLSLQETLAGLDQAIKEALGAVRETQTLVRQRVFEPNAAPIWAIARMETARDAWEKVRERRAKDLETLAEYLETHSAAFAGHLVLMASTLLLTLALNRRLQQWAKEEPQLGDAAAALSDPVSAMLLVGLATNRFFYPLPPAVFGNLVSILLLIPAVRLLPRIVDPPLRPVIYALAVFFASIQLRLVLQGAELVVRTLLALELAGAIAFLGFLLQPSRLAEAGEEVVERLQSWLGPFIKMLLVALSLAFLGNVFGYASFAMVLAEGLLFSAYAGAIFYGLYRVVRAFVTLGLHSSAARRLRMVRVGEARIRRIFDRVLRVGAFLWWLSVALETFEIRGAVLDAAEALVTTHATLGSVSISLGDLLLIAGIIWGSLLLSRFTRFFLEEDVFPRVVLRRGVSNAIATTVHYVLLIGGFLFAVAAAGMDLSRVTLLAGAFGVGIGFGLQNVVNNFVSGMILLFERPIQVGDTIEVGGLLGDVRRIGPRSSTVRTFDGAEVIVPNGMLISDQVINWTLSDRRRRIRVGVGVKYGTDPERVLAILREVAEENEIVLDDPAPLCIF
ncbi:MAG: mechanosensitive ion channel, partial [Myxococcota bacterium]|nr:mechanosensitive ion channel [Myxococcota bacterium]